MHEPLPAWSRADRPQRRPMICSIADCDPRSGVRTVVVPWSYPAWLRPRGRFRCWACIPDRIRRSCRRGARGLGPGRRRRKYLVLLVRTHTIQRPGRAGHDNARPAASLTARELAATGEQPERSVSTGADLACSITICSPPHDGMDPLHPPIRNAIAGLCPRPRPAVPRSGPTRPCQGLARQNRAPANLIARLWPPTRPTGAGPPRHPRAWPPPGPLSRTGGPLP